MRALRAASLASSIVDEGFKENTSPLPNEAAGSPAPPSHTISQQPCTPLTAAAARAEAASASPCSPAASFSEAVRKERRRSLANSISNSISPPSVNASPQIRRLEEQLRAARQSEAALRAANNKLQQQLSISQRFAIKRIGHIAAAFGDSS
eukprot:Tamp_29077.p2 GENE.Tamp_29077~~Tamp_29077.p2  ORF type:complete len:151 (-),score=35.73 Tamp_29077:122-574(-)